MKTPEQLKGTIRSIAAKKESSCARSAANVLV